MPLLYYAFGLKTDFRRLFAIRLFFDPVDLAVYFKSSAWVDGGGTLYRDIFSEYPLAANLIFGFVRLLSNFIAPFGAGLKSFAWTWITISWICFVQLVVVAKKQLSKAGFVLWLAPTTIYFSILRYDFYPAAASFFALLAFREKRWRAGILWFSACIALKGYAIFLLPALAVYLWRNLGLRKSAEYTLLALLPFTLAHLAILTFAGMAGLVMPYKFHIVRTFNGESVYDSLEFAWRGLGIDSEMRARWMSFISISGLPKFVAILFSLGAAVMRPKTFQGLVHALLVACMGFIASTMFCSPQWVLWALAIACFSASSRVLALSNLFVWVTFIYFPIAFDIKETHQKFFKNILAVVSSLKLMLIGAPY